MIKLLCGRKFKEADRRLDHPLGSPAVLGPFVPIGDRGGNEDPWLCVPDFNQVCLSPVYGVGRYVHFNAYNRVDGNVRFGSVAVV